METGGNLDYHSDQLLSQIMAKCRNDKAKQKWLEKAHNVVRIADATANYVMMTEVALMKEAGQSTPGGAFDQNDFMATQRLFLEKGKGKEFFERLLQCKRELLAVDSSFSSEYQNLIPIDFIIPLIKSESS